MKEELKQQLIKTLKFLKDHQDIDKLTLNQIQERLIQYESFLIELVEVILEDKENENGTLTTWWLYENVSKVIYPQGSSATKNNNVESPEDFVNYMVDSFKPIE